MGRSENQEKIKKQYKYETALAATLYLKSNSILSILYVCVYRISTISSSQEWKKLPCSISAAALIMQGREISLPFDTLRLHIQCHVREMISVNPFPQSGMTLCVVAPQWIPLVKHFISSLQLNHKTSTLILLHSTGMHIPKCIKHIDYWHDLSFGNLIWIFAFAASTF